MPYFKIRSASSKKLMIKSESVPDIIETAIKKLNLPETEEYKLVLDSDGTEFDSDEILLDFAKDSAETLVLLVTPKHVEWQKENNSNLANDVPLNNSENCVPQNQIDKPSTSISKETILNFDEIIWSKIQKNIFLICESGKKLDPRDRREIVRCIKNYMIFTKNTSRTLAGQFAKKLCDMYPKTFADQIGGKTFQSDNEVWSNGYETLTLQIYNSVKYEEQIIKTKSNKRKKVNATHDSDDEQIENLKKEKILAQKWDEYGCLEYAPDLPSTETAQSQEEKRLKLKISFELSEKNEAEVLKLMNDTYYTQRALINEQTRNLNDIVIDWPFLTDPLCFIQHASRLLGKDVIETLNDTLLGKAKVIRLYLKIREFSKQQNEKLKKIFEDSKKTVEVNKSNLHKVLVIFPLLAAYFDEEIDFFIHVKKEDEESSNFDDSAQIKYPMLLIEGKSLYHENCKWTVIVNKDIKISCTEALQGILITFLSYYVFGLKYNPSIDKTLEFIQRYFLKINPEKGSKSDKGKKNKRRKKNYDTKVFSFARALSEFSDEFKSI